MEVKTRDVQYYQREDGQCPAKQWLNGLKDLKGKAIIDVRIRRAGLGNFGNHKFVGDGVIELKIPFGPGYRVYFSVVSNDEVLLLLIGGDKSTQDKDIKKANEYLNDWRSNENSKLPK